ncbi:hypothetical protein ZIOFF_038012 [Zingiber officinale]|uniref:Uncharacterized protein n=1 Tax=Zingiber officinale TaxID=94328 RepID=A0A8J5L4J0_ZINOF|nr:hypothetical protein ZIOFF_038012 [Zingiber officinale]
MATSLSIAVGSEVWVEDPDVAWIDGEVLDVRGDELIVKCSSGKKVNSDQMKVLVTAKLSEIYPKDPEAAPCGVDDMTKLAYLHEPGVLQNLKSRYDMNEIYTYTGSILIAVNPFRRLPHLYDIHMMKQYKGANFGELNPHPFAVADAAYRQMIKEGIRQSILVSGESGAGKTESTKMLMRYLAYIGGRSESDGRSIEQLVLQSNPVLEAFGNAKTIRNNNSMVEILSFGLSNLWSFNLIKMEGYLGLLLEPIFLRDLEYAKFQILREITTASRCSVLLHQSPVRLIELDIERYRVGNPRTFHYLNQSNCFELDAIDDAKEYLETKKAMDIIGVSGDEQVMIAHHRLVDKINNSIGQDSESKKIIGVLDIYGFESFKTNSFEQFCIKLTNEKLQQHFNQKPGGIIALLHEACMLPRSTHETFAQKLYQSFKNNKCFNKPKLSRSDFTICHYAGDQQLQALLETLNATEPHYIRCIKPNNLLKPSIFENHNVLQQLRCGGVLEAIRISCAGFPTRRTFCEFVDRFGILAPEVLDESCDDVTASRILLEKVNLKDYQADIEETKTQENEKLQVALQEMQQKFDELKALLAKEREVANVAVKEVSFIKEVPVSDTALLDKLRDENEKLKALVSSLRTKIAETEKKYEESIITSEQRLKKAMEAESEIVDLKNAMDRLQEKLSSLESEAQILRQRAVFSSPIKSMQEHLPTPISPTKQYLETDQLDFEEMKVANLRVSQSAGQALRDTANSDAKLRRSSMERNQENLDALIKCVSKNIGFSQEKPVAASTIYKCLLHWKSFEVEKTSVFDRLIEMFGSVIEEEENNNHLAYWLSNGSHLLYLLQHNLKVTSAVGGTPNRKPTAPTSFFGRMTRSFRSSSHALDELSAVQQVEAKYPALLFKLQLTAYVEKIYGIIRDNVKKDLLRSLSLCIQAPRAASVSLRSSSGLQVQSNNWQAIIERFDNLLNTLQENYVPLILIEKMFTQIFSYLNVQILNSLLLRRECCSFSNGEHMKAGLVELELWCKKTKPEYIGSSWDELKHVRQAVDFLVLFQKSRVSFDDIVNDLCPVLSVYQLYRIGTHYWDDKYNTKSVSADVLSRLRRLMSEVTSEVKSSSFLLDDNSSIPFSVDEISNSLRLEEFLEVRPAADLLDDPAFHFLLQ